MVKQIAMKPMALHRHIIAYITLGILCGWYYFLTILYPMLLFSILYYKSIIATAILAAFISLTVIPLRTKGIWRPITKGWLWDIWLEYFDFTYDIANQKLEDDQKYMFFEIPHGVFPIGPLISIALSDDICGGREVHSIGADAIFSVPVMRHIWAWIGTRPAKRQNITDILNEGHICAVIPGGIAEMFLASEAREEIYLKRRLSTVKAAIEEGANIVPIFFFGNTLIFDTVGGKGTDSALAKISRKFQRSLVFFYGRNYLPVPYRQPIHLVASDIIKVKQNLNPTDEEVEAKMKEVVKAVEILYMTKKPEWETRPLVIH